MSTSDVSLEDKTREHYFHGQLLTTIKRVLAQQHKSLQQLTLTDLAPVDEFHVGGRQASIHFLAQLNLLPQDKVLDIGCALGGSARFVATNYQAKVIGIDLSDEYIATGNVLSTWLKLSEKVQLLPASALALPFADNSFSKAYMMHVGMNIADKNTLFSETYRVLQQGGLFGIYDIVRTSSGDLTYPVPWASKKEHSYLANFSQYEQALNQAGFEVITVNNRHEFAVNFFNKMAAKNTPKAQATLGVHTLMQASSHAKINNMLTNIKQGLISPLEIIAWKK